MRVAFYAPLKPPDHPVPSGDRRMARLLIVALTRAGHEVAVAARLRAYDRDGLAERQARLAALGGRLAARYVARVRDQPPAQRPQAWITYHLYHKAPDWIGPRVATQLAIPYVVIEASVAGKRAGGPWSLGHEATIAALARAAAVVSLNPADEPGIAPHVTDRSRLHRLRPFLDAQPYAAAAGVRSSNRVVTAQRFNLDTDVPWLLAVGMMRPGDKLESYMVLGDALARLVDRPWSLLVVGDGPARDAVRGALAPLGPRVAYAGALAEAELATIYAAADLYVWPAVNEAYGMAILEAQASGLPVVAGAVGGVGGIVADGRTGRLVKPHDPEALAAALAPLLANEDQRRALALAARAKVAAEHDLPAAAAALDRILAAALSAAPQAKMGA
jgi:glycosyltransferase involved in cell wall biosynthesis